MPRKEASSRSSASRSESARSEGDAIEAEATSVDTGAKGSGWIAKLSRHSPGREAAAPVSVPAPVPAAPESRPTKSRTPSQSRASCCGPTDRTDPGVPKRTDTVRAFRSRSSCTFTHEPGVTVPKVTGTPEPVRRDRLWAEMSTSKAGCPPSRPTQNRWEPEPTIGSGTVFKSKLMERRRASRTDRPNRCKAWPKCHVWVPAGMDAPTRPPG